MTRRGTLVVLALASLAACGPSDSTTSGLERRRELRGTVQRLDATLHLLRVSTAEGEQSLTYLERTQVVDRSGARRSIESLPPGTMVQAMVRPNETGAQVVELLTILPPSTASLPSIIEPPAND